MIENKLIELAREEALLLSVVAAIKGSENERINFLDKNGIFSKYRQIHLAYSELALQGDAEALKRGFFLQWINSLEPSYLTGLPNSSMDKRIAPLYQVAETSLNMEMEKVIACNGNRDAVLMAAFYYSVHPSYFSEVGFSVNVMTVLEKMMIYLPEIPLQHGERGQLGEYWKSIQSQNMTSQP
jgi:hypothetical protein